MPSEMLRRSIETNPPDYVNAAINKDLFRLLIGWA
jgi:hypothetical protein